MVVGDGGVGVGRDICMFQKQTSFYTNLRSDPSLEVLIRRHMLLLRTKMSAGD